jgi:hypothetical protein
MAGKRYGARLAEVKPLPFEFELYRDHPEHDDPVAEVHEFTAMPRLDAGQLIRLLTGVDSAESNPGDMLHALSEGIRKALSDKDGTPQHWRPTALPKVEDKPLSFRGPDGQFYPFTDQAAIEKFSAFDAGSSRRRWAHLLFDDEQVSVPLEPLVELAQDLIEAGSGRPT